MTRYATYTQVKRSFSKWLDVAEKEPIYVKRRGKRSAVLVSVYTLDALKQELRDLLQQAITRRDATEND